jgi:nucleotide-binding universal stress UspA family protein
MELTREERRVKVMIATDGSVAAVEATKRAVELLRADAEIVLLTVIPEKEDPMETAGGIEGPALTEEEAEREFTEGHLAGEQALQTTAEALGHPADTRLAPAEAEPGHAIVDIAHETQPDLLVIGSSGKSLFKRLFTGSISDYVVHHAPCPVLVIRQDER